MGKLAKCLDKLRKAFSDQDRAKILEYNDKYKAEGKSDAEAENLAILDFKEDLNNDLNELKEKVKIKLDKASPAKLEVVKPKSTGKRDKINNVISKIDTYNSFSKKEKSGVVGNRVYNEIQALIKELGFSIERLKNKGRFRLVSDKGKKVNKSPNKRTPEQIEADSKDKALRKRALNAIPTSVEHSVIMDIANGYQFNLNEFERISGIASSEVPPLLFTKKGGISFEFYKERLNEKGFNTILDEQEIQEIVKDVLVGFADKKVHRDFREKAIREAVEIYNENDEFNQGKSPDEIAYLEDLQRKENEARDAAERLINERELSDIEVQEKLAEDEARAEYEKSQAGDQYKKKAVSKGDVQKVLDRIKKVMPKVNVVIDNKLDAAGKVQGNTLTINPYYAGTDTPIHEAGHILIDALGYKNALIQAAVKQLKDTKLWKETKERYSELNEEMLAKEVLAEAIGREGANIFDKEIDKSKFRAILDRIFEKLKQLLGIDKNIAKSLARQIIRGEGTKDLVGTSAEEQFAKRQKSDDEIAMEKLYEMLQGTEDLTVFPYEQLIQAYNLIITSKEIPGNKSNKIRKELLKRMGMNIFQRGINMVKNDPKFSEEKAIKKDISWLDKHLKVLSHFTEAFPEMKFLADKFQEAFFNKTTEANQKKTLNEKLAIKVIKDRRSKLGLLGKAKDRFGELFGNQNYKYFDYLDNGKGDLITVEEAKKKGLSEAQINYLKFVREQIAEREGIVGSDAYDMNMSVIKTDKRFYESFNTENAVAATSALLGNTHNINKVRIEFKNPNTGKNQTTEYENIEKILIDYGKKGIKQKIEAMAKIANYNIKARRQLKQMVNADEKGEENVLNVIRKGDYSLTDKGQLVSKFDKPRDPSRAYSKDFYSAMVDFIDDTQHVKHVGPLLPIINSIDYLNKNGVYQYDENGNKIKTLHAQKDNVREWLKGWVDLHVIKRPNETDPTIDASLKFLRTLASLSTMMFNTAAQGMNLAIGIYNNWRKENSQTVAIGLSRLFGGVDRAATKDTGYGLVNPISAAILKKYGAVSTDIASNPIATAGGIFAKLGFLGTRWGEYVIQGSGLLGKMTKDEFNSFEFQKNKFGEDELVVKKDAPFTEEQLKKKILGYIDEVSDVQGKYSEKDRRNIMNNEFGKALMQYKVWIPDWFRVRFGEKGSFTSMFNGGIKEMRDQMRDEGFMKTFITGKDTQAVKDFKSNLKGLITTVFLYTLVHSDDDDDDSKVVATAKRALGDVLFIFDPNNLKWTLNRPIAAIGKVNDLLDAMENLKDLEFEKAGKKAAKLVPGKKIVDVVEDLTDED